MQSHHHLGVASVCNKLDATLCCMLYAYFLSAALQMKVGVSFPLRKVKREDLALLRPKGKKTIAALQLFT
jgi:hypothetical protein